jgi:hypothetical protein
MWRAILSVITAPITAPTFFHTYVADVFTSMVKGETFAVHMAGVFPTLFHYGCIVFLIPASTSLFQSFRIFYGQFVSLHPVIF